MTETEISHKTLHSINYKDTTHRGTAISLNDLYWSHAQTTKQMAGMLVHAAQLKSSFQYGSGQRIFYQLVYRMASTRMLFVLIKLVLPPLPLV